MRGLYPKLGRPNLLEPSLEPGPIPLEGLRQRVARILAEPVRHAFSEPSGLKEPRSEAAEMFILKMVNKLVTNEVWAPPTITDNKADRGDGICVLMSKAELFGARWRRAKHCARRGLWGAH